MVHQEELVNLSTLLYKRGLILKKDLAATEGFSLIGKNAIFANDFLICQLVWIKEKDVLVKPITHWRPKT